MQTKYRTAPKQNQQKTPDGKLDYNEKFFLIRFENIYMLQNKSTGKIASFKSQRAAGFKHKSDLRTAWEQTSIHERLIPLKNEEVLLAADRYQEIKTGIKPTKHKLSEAKPQPVTNMVVTKKGSLIIGQTHPAPEQFQPVVPETIIVMAPDAPSGAKRF